MVFIEKHHDLPDHVAHRIIPELFGDRHQAHAFLGEPADVELEVEVVTGEPVEAVLDNDIERRRLGDNRRFETTTLAPCTR
jgi:hypothetical protein